MVPVNWLGGAFISLAIVLFVLEATVTSHGILALGGIVAMIAGGLMLVEGPIPQLRIRLSTTLAVAIPLSAITVILVRLRFFFPPAKSVTRARRLILRQGGPQNRIHHNRQGFLHR